MTRALHAEWTKLRTVRSTGWLLLGVTVLTVGLSTLIAWSTPHDGCVPDDGACDLDSTRLALAGVHVGQLAAVVFGVLVASSEYATGTMRTTLAAVPRRYATFVAKAVVVSGPVLVAAVLGVAGSLLAARSVMPDSGFANVALDDSTTLRAAVGTALYLCLVALLSLGVALIVRNTGGAIGGVLSLLFVFPILAELVTQPDWRERLTEWSPMSAGLAVQATTNLEDLPIGPWQGLGVLAAYAVAGLALGWLALERRDA
jgi:ABC-2 type transport system permease protein